MNKADKVCIAIIFIVSILFYIPLILNDMANKDKPKEVVVNYKSEEILREDMSKDALYIVRGTLGDVEIEIKDEAVRVEKETSPYHLCSIQGWVKDTGRPIICLPNEIVVQIEAGEDTENGVDTVIQ